MTMKRNLLLALALVALVAMPTGAAVYKTFETVTVTNAAVGLTSTTYKPDGTPQMDHCTFRVETADIRIRWDGTSPTASVGVLVSALDVFTVDSGTDLSQLKMIRTAATNATVTAACWAN